MPLKLISEQRKIKRHNERNITIYKFLFCYICNILLKIHINA